MKSQQAIRQLTIVLPKYTPDASQWKRQICEVAMEASQREQINFTNSEPLEVEIILYMRGGLARRDIDNRVKQVLDAVHGRLGRNGRVNGLFADDKQIFRIVAEKRQLPVGIDKANGGLLTLRPYRGVDIH